MSADDEKTRVLQRRPGPPAAESLDGKIVFHCPNGHRIIVAAGLGGKRGKCSKCGIDVTIPRVGDAPLAPEAAPQADAPVEPDRASEAPAAAAPEPEAPVAPGADFQLESPPVPVQEASTEAERPGGEGEGQKEGWDFIGGQPDQPAAEGFESVAWTSQEAAGGFATEAGNPTAMLVGRLWVERQHGGIIELHLTGGSVILPEWYDANWSRGTHGLFASQAADGSVTLTAVAWETVQKVVVRQLTEVPNDMFT